MSGRRTIRDDDFQNYTSDDNTSGSNQTQQEQQRAFLEVPVARRYRPRDNTGYKRLAQQESNPREDLWKRPSVILPSLVDLEKRFFALVAAGDVNNVKLFLKSSNNFNLNCTNFQGMTALHVATKSHNEEMVQLLLEQPGLEVGDCALHAIRDNQPTILFNILDKLANTNPVLEFAGSIQSTDFPDDMTPLIYAAHCGHYEIIGTLMERGHRIDRPHPAECKCVEVCVRNATDKDGLTVSKSRLNLYRAIVNPAYICHTSDDPILAAFEVCAELQKWAKMEQEFYVAYKELAREARQFGVDLISCCRSTQEVELVLTQRGGCNFPGQFLFPRLMLAMDYNQKEFVAHPNTQQVLEAAWRGEWYEWRLRSDWMKMLSVFPRMVMLPVMAVMCIFMPKHAMVTRWRLPCNKMLSSVATYLIFLTIVFLESNIDKSEQKRGPPNSGWEPVLVIYVIAYIWSLVRQCVIQGPKRFFHVLYNWYDLAMQLLFALTFFFWLAAAIDVGANDERDLERKYWKDLDPTLIAEGFFAVATILAFGRLLLLCQLNYHLGPLQVSLGKMIKDIAKFVAIFTIILISFSAGLNRLYQYYDGMVQEDHVTGIKTVQASSFVNFEATLKTLFWALFCMSPIESADVVIENLQGADRQMNVINKHTFTEAIGHISFALFEVMSVIVILNMLIATMSNTFQKVTDNVDIEWTFGRTEVYLGYMSKTTLPPPFNVIPTYTGTMVMVDWVKTLLKPNSERQAKFSATHCCYVELTEPEDRSKEFTVLTAQLVQRYFNSR